MVAVRITGVGMAAVGIAAVGIMTCNRMVWLWKKFMQTNIRAWRKMGLYQCTALILAECD
jgi:hypothetical protein